MMGFNGPLVRREQTKPGSEQARILDERLEIQAGKEWLLPLRRNGMGETQRRLQW